LLIEGSGYKFKPKNEVKFTVTFTVYMLCLYFMKSIHEMGKFVCA